MMKYPIFIALILMFLEGIAQNPPVSDRIQYTERLNALTIGTSLERPLVSDSIRFEIRLWINDYFLPTKLIQITSDNQNLYSYKIGYLKSKEFITIDSLKKEIDWNEFQKRINSFEFNNFPNQDEIELSLYINGIERPMSNEHFFSSIFDGVDYIFQVYDNKNHITIHYNNPHSYLKKLQEKDLSTM